MRKWLISLLMVGASGWAAAPFALTISGTVTASGAGLAGVQMTAPKATCTITDAAGSYSCQVASGWSGTLAPYLTGWTFVLVGDVQKPAAASFATLGANQSAVNFVAAPMTGLRAELALRRTSGAVIYLDYNNDSVPDATVPFGVASDVALAGDVNGDGITDLVLFRSGVWYASTHQDGVVDATYYFGAPSDQPLLGDIDGDGTADLIVFRSGTWYVSTLRNGVADRTYHFGLAGDTALVGDFDADGIADLAVFRNGVWSIDTNRDGAPDLVIPFGGVVNEIPAALDYDGDGRADIAVYRDGLWYVNTSLDGALTAGVPFGAAGDRPLAGFWNRAKTRFVKAGASCLAGCTAANPYATITAAWQDAVDGDIIRVAKGTYPEPLDFSYPGNQYMPGKFGKNNIKVVGVSKYTTIVSPSAGDALYVRGASGYILRGLRLSAQAAGARGIVLAGGIGSVLPSFPGPQVNVSVTDIIENPQTNALLTGTSNAWFRYARINRSRAGHGLSGWGYTYVRVVSSDISSNGYMVAPAVAPPDAGKGLDIRDDSEGEARRSTFHNNLTYAIVDVGRSVVRLNLDTIDGAGVNGINVCASGITPDTSVIYMTNNWVAANGLNWPGGQGSGMEVFLTCSGTQTISGNVFIGNALNGLFVASGTANITNNTFQANTIGLTLYATDGFAGEERSFTSPVATLYGNTYDANVRVGIFPERYPGSTLRDVFATVGGTGAGQKNIFKNYAPPKFHAIGCYNVTTNFKCALGANVFDHSGDDVEQPACNAACVSTP